MRYALRKRILVTGGVGFLGSHLCSRLLDDDEQKRSFCYVDDLSEGIVRLPSSDDQFVGPIDLGNPEEFSIRLLAETILELSGSRSKLTFRPLPEDDPRQRQPDIALAKEMLDWEPSCALRDGLVQTIKYFDSQLSNRFAMESKPVLTAV